MRVVSRLHNCSPNAFCSTGHKRCLALIKICKGNEKPEKLICPPSIFTVIGPCIATSNLTCGTPCMKSWLPPFTVI